MKENQNKVVAIVLAAGRGSRIKAAVNKMFLNIDGIPLLYRTLASLNKIKVISAVIVVCRNDEEQEIQKLIEKFGALEKLKAFVTGGSERSDSVRNGLRYFVKNFNEPLVMTHDGARPFISETLVEQLVSSVQRGAISIPVLPLYETIRRKTEGAYTEIVNRENLFATQTPQVFHKEDIESCFFDIGTKEEQFTDEASYFEKAGRKTLMITGDKRNIKVTTPEDLVWAECLLNCYKDL